MNLKKNILKTYTIFLSVLIFIPSISFSQSLILSSAKTGDYSSPYSIILAPGFTTSGPFRAFIAAQPVNTTSKGYLVDEIIKVEGVKDDSQIYQLGAAQRQTTRTYVDGFGRPTQQIIVKGSPSQKDIVQNVVYDNLGMQTRTYLPYAASDGTGNFRTNAMNEQSAFYNNGSSDKIADDSKPYSEQIFENSPLQRMMVSGGVGNGYQPGEHSVSLTYRLNVGSDGVHRWNADGSTASDYVAGSLSVLVSTDQQGNQSIVFKDIVGNIVLKKQQLDGNISGQNVAWLDTYYVYDDLGKIRYVVPPKAAALLQAATNRNLDQGSINPLLFHYVYDDRGRTVERTVPGGATIYMIYDPYNRLVMAQDGNLRLAKQWNYIKYDSRNIPVSQGIYTNTDYISRTTMQSYVSGLPYSTYFEERNGDSSTGYYTNVSFPTTSIEPLGYSYFNDYDLDGNGTADYTYANQGLSGEDSAVSNIRGMATVVRKRTIGSGLNNIWLTSVIFYNKRGVAIQTLSNNQLNAAVNNTKTVVADFTGKPLLSKTVRVANSVSTTVLTTMGYDHMDRVLTVDEKVNTNPTLRVANYEYNEIGQLVDKKLNSTNSGDSYLQSVDFRYSITGQMLSINNSSLSVDDKNDDSNDVFGMQFSYDQTDAAIGNTPYYNGMISAVKWKSITPMSTSPDERSYKFSYDKLYRLTSANYQEKSGSSWYGTGAFDEKDITYDHNGNILTLKRNAKIGGVISEIDNLNYSYIANQLSNITDGQAETNSNYGFRNLTASTAGYEYDSDGSLIHDTKKGLQLSYNVLNKTNAITMTGSAGRYITYTYDATGSLLRKQVYDNNALVKTTDYIEGYIFENGGLSQFGMAEGRVRNTSGALKYEYMIADNLGNVRVSFEDVNGIATVRQENSYYPFGLIMPGGYTSSQPNKNLYNGGSEWQDDFSNLPDYSSTFYRNYDAALGRFVAVDPKAESAESFTTYQFAGNNPLIYNDPMGDVMRLGDSNYTIPSHRIGPGSGNHWSDGIGYPDWSLDGGSDTYRALLGTAGVMQNSTGGFYTMDGGVKRDVKIGTNGYYTYQGQILNGGMTAQDLKYFMQMTGGNYAYLINLNMSPGIKATWHEANQGGVAQSSFAGDNWKDIGFLANDLTQSFINRNTTLAISKGYNLAKSTVFLPLGLATRTSTGTLSALSKTGGLLAKAAPWVAAGSIGINIAVNKQVTAGDVYQSIVTGASLVPGWGLIVGGGALLLEGGSYYFTGKSVSDNINSHLNGGVIYSWK